MTEQNKLKTQKRQAKRRERRSFFRIDDTVRLSVRRDFTARSWRAAWTGWSMISPATSPCMSSLAAITAQMTVGLRRIENRDPDLAAYLRAIDQKIEVIGRAFIAQEPELVAQKAVPVNLSAGGMCAGVEEALRARHPPRDPNAAVPVVHRPDDLRHRGRMQSGACCRGVERATSTLPGSSSPTSGNRTGNYSSGTCCGARAISCGIVRRKSRYESAQTRPRRTEVRPGRIRADARRG